MYTLFFFDSGKTKMDFFITLFPQIPIQTLNGVANLLKNVHSRKRNFISINVHVGKQPDDTYASRPSYSKPETNFKPDGYPKPDKYPTKLETTGFPDYTPVLPGSTGRPITGVTGVNIPEEYKPETPNNEVNEPSLSTTGGIDPGLLTDTQGTTLALDQNPSVYKPSEETVAPYKPSEQTVAPYRPSEQPVATYKPVELTASGFRPSESASGYRPKPSEQSTASYKPSEPEYERIPPAPAVQPPYTRSSVAQPLSLEVGDGLSFDKAANRERNFKEYVQRKLAEKNLQDNRISNTF